MRYIQKYLAILLLTLISQPSFAIDYGAILIDVSGSMDTGRSDGQTRCSVAFQAAEKALQDFFEKAGGKRLKIYTFEARGQLRSFSSNYLEKSAALAALASVPRSCTGAGTALAESICSIVDELRISGRGLPDPKLALFVMTDGQENDSISCISAPEFTPQAYIKSPWHKAVFDRVMNGHLVKVASLVFWPEANEIPDDFNFLKYLSLASGSDMGGGLTLPPPSTDSDLGGSMTTQGPSGYTLGQSGPIMIPGDPLNPMGPLVPIYSGSLGRPALGGSTVTSAASYGVGSGRFSVIQDSAAFDLNSVGFW